MQAFGAESGVDGFAEFDALPSHETWAARADRRGITATQALDGREFLEARIVLEEPKRRVIQVRGRVLLEGRGVEGARVGSDREGTTSGANGEYELTLELGARRHQSSLALEATLRDVGGGFTTVDLLRQPEDADAISSVDIELSALGRIEGIVRWDGGDALPGAVVALVRPTRAREDDTSRVPLEAATAGTVMKQHTSDVDGRFAVPAFEGPEYALEVRFPATGLRWIEGPVRVGEAVEVVLPESARPRRIDGEVVDDRGRGVAGAQVQLVARGLRSSGVGALHIPIKLRTDLDGHYILEGASLQGTELWVSAERTVPIQIPTSRVVEGGGRIRLERTRRILVEGISSDGDGAHLVFEDATGSPVSVVQWRRGLANAIPWVEAPGAGTSREIEVDPAAAFLIGQRGDEELFRIPIDGGLGDTARRVSLP